MKLIVKMLQDGTIDSRVNVPVPAWADKKDRDYIGKEFATNHHTEKDFAGWTTK